MDTPQVNVLDPQFEGAPLGRIFKLVNENSPKPTEANDLPPYAGLQVPEDPAERGALLQRLIDAFAVSSSANFDGERLVIMKEALKRAMPDPEKDPENFTRFVQDRCHGVLEMLRLLVVMQGNKPDKTPRGFSKNEIYNETLAMGALALPASAIVPRPVGDLIGNERDEVMCPRANRVKTILAMGPLGPRKARNRELMVEIVRKFVGNEVIDNVMKCFSDKMDKLEHLLSAPEYTTAQWFGVLLNKLAGVHPRRSDIDVQLQRLANALKDADTLAAVSKSIDTFGDPVH